MSEQKTDTDVAGDKLTADARLRRRHRAERRFKGVCVGALLLAAAFLVMFLGSMVVAAYPAFTQTEVKVEVDFSNPDQAWRAIDPKLNPVVSRGVTRLLPRKLENNPELAGETTEEWVLAKAEIDQYRKGKESLDPEVQEQVDRLEEQGRFRYSFNHWLFTEGDSKLPEMAGLKAAIVGSIYVLALTLAFAFPVGVLSAIYLEEFADSPRRSRSTSTTWRLCRRSCSACSDWRS